MHYDLGFFDKAPPSHAKVPQPSGFLGLSQPRSSIAIVREFERSGAKRGGGSTGEGTVFKIDPRTGSETVLHSFTGSEDGAFPYAELFYHHGNLYGTTYGAADHQMREPCSGSILSRAPKRYSIVFPGQLTGPIRMQTLSNTAVCSTAPLQRVASTASVRYSWFFWNR
jgi:uncharacterized repeat protein (TIGR03803 family)